MLAVEVFQVQIVIKVNRGVDDHVLAGRLGQATVVADHVLIGLTVKVQLIQVGRDSGHGPAGT